MTLARKFRLKGEKLIEEVKREGRLFQSDNFGVCLKKDPDKEESPKFAFIISKKISKLAVQRNRVKRAISETLRQNMDIVPEGYNYVFLGKKNLTGMTTDEIANEVKMFLKKLSLKGN